MLKTRRINIKIRDGFITHESNGEHITVISPWGCFVSAAAFGYEMQALKICNRRVEFSENGRIFQGLERSEYGKNTV